MDGLRGVVFVAQLPSHQPEVIFQRLSPGEEDLPPVAGHTRGGSTGSSAEAGIRRSIVSVSEDLKHAVRECFGIPSKIFAKLMLPDDALCNLPFYLEIDAGRRQTVHQHGPWSHLLFVSFPCNVAEFSRPKADAVDTFVEQPSNAVPVDPRKRVQRFNVVYALDSRLTRRQDEHTTALWRVSAHLAQALVNEEARDGYLSREVERLASAPLEDPSPSTGSASPGGALASHGLDRLLEEALGGVREQGYSSLRVNGSLHCQVCVFPTDEVPTPPTHQQALVLTCARDDLLEELGPDSSDVHHMKSVVEVADPRTSVGELAIRLAFPLGKLQQIAQHLIYWKKMRIVEVFQEATRVDVRRGAADAGPCSPLVERFNRWQRGFVQEQESDSAGLKFAEVIKAFMGGRSVKDIEQSLRAAVDFDQLLEWLVSEKLLVQLAQYYHFTPGRAKSDPQRLGFRVSEHLLQEFCPALLTDFEVRLLGARAANEQQHRFLCRFAAEFARGHRRADGDRLAAFVGEQGGDFTLEQVNKILEANTDIFVSYVCGC